MISNHLNTPQKILIVEDNIVNRKLLIRQLVLLGYAAEAVVNGQYAVEYLAEHQVDCVLMDCQMPVMDGYAATTTIRQQEEGTGRRTLIIGLTAYAQESDLQKCLDVGMDDYLEKPALAGDIQKVIDKWLSKASKDDPASEEQKTSHSMPTGDRPNIYPSNLQLYCQLL